MRAEPTEAHRFNRSAFWLCADMGGVASAVAFAEGVTTSNQCDSFFVVHRHAGKGVADVEG